MFRRTIGRPSNRFINHRVKVRKFQDRVKKFRDLATQQFFFSGTETMRSEILIVSEPGKRFAAKKFKATKI